MRTGLGQLLDIESKGASSRIDKNDVEPRGSEPVYQVIRTIGALNYFANKK